MELVHEPCAACEREAYEGDVICAVHGPTTVVSEQTYTGYAGGTCFTVTLGCGCTLADESADVEAAR